MLYVSYIVFNEAMIMYVIRLGTFEPFIKFYLAGDGQQSLDRILLAREEVIYFLCENGPKCFLQQGTRKLNSNFRSKLITLEINSNKRIQHIFRVHGIWYKPHGINVSSDALLPGL